MKQRLALLALMALFLSPAYGQKDFTSLSARVRTQMAEEEVISSESDAVFQALMTDGMQHFEAREYEMAIQKFTEAQDRRPINVYPPVMIEDVKLAMANPPVEEETVPEPEPIAKPKDTTPQLSAEERVELMYQEELAKVYDKKPDDSKNEELAEVNEQLKRSSEREATSTGPEGIKVRSREEIIADGGVEIEGETAGILPDRNPAASKSESTDNTVSEHEEGKTVVEIQSELAATYPDGITEDTFTEGNRTITKRVVVKDGIGNEYRKVKHGWGGEFFFKNGTSITERVWNEETLKK